MGTIVIISVFTVMKNIQERILNCSGIILLDYEAIKMV